jgi:DNA polymerase I
MEKIMNDKPIMIIDFSQIAFSTFFVNRITVDNIFFWRYLVLQTIKKLNISIPNKEVILATDYSSWRKEIFPNYKINRKKSQEEDSAQTLFNEIRLFQDELKENFPYKIIKVYKAEGDDVMAILAQKLSESNKVVIASGDKDLVQLIDTNIQVYNPFKAVWSELNGS